METNLQTGIGIIAIILLLIIYGYVARTYKVSKEVLKELRKNK